MQTDRRVDTRTREIIERGITIDQMEGAIKAWVFLAQHGISANTISRVLGLSVSSPMQGQIVSG